MTSLVRLGNFGCEGYGSQTRGTGVATMQRFDAYLTIKEAAEFLSVSPNTLRNWGGRPASSQYTAIR